MSASITNLSPNWKLHQNAPNRVLNFKKFQWVTPPGDPYTGCSTPGERERGWREEEWDGRSDREGGEGIIHLLLPQAHAAFATYAPLLEIIQAYAPTGLLYPLSRPRKVGREFTLKTLKSVTVSSFICENKEI